MSRSPRFSVGRETETFGLPAKRRVAQRRSASAIAVPAKLSWRSFGSVRARGRRDSIREAQVSQTGRETRSVASMEALWGVFRLRQAALRMLGTNLRFPLLSLVLWLARSGV